MKPNEFRRTLPLLLAALVGTPAENALADETAALPASGPDRIVTRASCTPAGSNFLNI
ncbi:MAG: hypothetical protein RLZZ09_108, partial [Pseudomonadota bacterium]